MPSNIAVYRWLAVRITVLVEIGSSRWEDLNPRLCICDCSSLYSVCSGSWFHELHASCPCFNVSQSGLIISYRLLPSHAPTRPDKLWYGRIDDVSRSRSSPLVGFCYVTVLDEGYEEMTEIVFFDQIVGIFT